MASDSEQNQQLVVRRPDPSHQQWRAPPPPQESFYLPGFEPSAPPEPLPYNNEELRHGELLPEPHHHKPSGLPPGTRLVDILGAAFARFWRTSHTVLRLDLRRAIDVDGPVVRGRDSGSPRGSYGRNRQHRTSNYPEDWVEGGSASSSWIQGIHGGGARLKLMQIWEFPDKETGLPSLPWKLNFGLGATLETDSGGHLELEARIKTKHVTLYILPSPLLQFRGKWPITGTRLAIDLRYMIPLLDLDQFWESPAAQLYVGLYNPVGTGFHLSPGGLEFDEHVVNIGQHTKLRVAASVEFPRKFPLEEGEQPVRVHINRLGIKSRIS